MSRPVVPVRILVGCAAAAVALLSSGLPGHAAPRNRPPAKPTELGMVNPSRACGTAKAPSWFPVSDVPDLRAVVTDPDGGLVTAEFEVTGKKLAAAVRLEATGSSATAAIVGVPRNPDGGFLAGEGNYSWRVRGKDATRPGPWSPRCYFALDGVAPVRPTVAVTPAQPANGYTQGDVVTLTFGPGTSKDVVAYVWSATGDTAGGQTWVPGTPAPRLTLTRPGLTPISVRAVDRAGQSGPTATVDLQVVAKAVAPAHRWLLDERSGRMASDAVGGAALALSGDAAFLPAGSGGRNYPDVATDGALRLAAGGSAATTATNVVDPDRDWSVTAWVRPGALGSARDAVSEVGAFRIGTTVQEVYDPIGDVTVREDVPAVTITYADGTSETVTMPDVRVQAGAWYGLGVSYSAAENAVVLAVREGKYPPVTRTLALAKPPGVAGGALRLGGSWVGDVDAVTTYAGALGSQGLSDALNYG